MEMLLHCSSDLLGLYVLIFLTSIAILISMALRCRVVFEGEVLLALGAV